MNNGVLSAGMCKTGAGSWQSGIMLRRGAGSWQSGIMFQTGICSWQSGSLSGQAHQYETIIIRS
ncbi:MAG: hypothetical protein K6G42_03420 [Lachnospiraceae bacterium]|nr:hypothetical protein [Lachnospiraceae bacterium]